MDDCTLVFDGAELVFKSPYSPPLVAALKAQIPAQDRRWDPNAKAWRVLPRHGQTCANLAAQYCRRSVRVPATQAVTARQETRMFEVRYVGITKDRGDGTRSAFGLVAGKWSLVFPEETLRVWFGIETRPDEETTLYGILGIKQDADEGAIKSAYRRLARQWHPDVCREPDAAEQFKAITHAYQILSDWSLRQKYNAGLALSKSLSISAEARAAIESVTAGYRCPFRCGLLLVDGTEQLGRFVVSRILAWEDIVQGGLTLVTSWVVGADAPMEQWV